MTAECVKNKLGKVVDIRAGKPYGEAWKRFLESPSWVEGHSFGELGANMSKSRPAIFEEFLRREGLTDVDTIIGPLGDDLTAGAVKVDGVTDQIVIRSQEVADELKKIIKDGSS